MEVFAELAVTWLYPSILGRVYIAIELFMFCIGILKRFGLGDVCRAKRASWHLTRWCKNPLSSALQPGGYIIQVLSESLGATFSNDTSIPWRTLSLTNPLPRTLSPLLCSNIPSFLDLPFELLQPKELVFHALLIHSLSRWFIWQSISNWWLASVSVECNLSCCLIFHLSLSSGNNTDLNFSSGLTSNCIS